MHVRIKQFITTIAVVAVIVDIFLGAFVISYYITELIHDVENNYKLAQGNHHDIITIKHRLKIGDYNAAK